MKQHRGSIEQSILRVGFPIKKIGPERQSGQADQKMDPKTWSNKNASRIAGVCTGCVRGCD